MGENYETVIVTTLQASCSAQPWVMFPKHTNVPIILTQEEDSGFGQGEGLRNREG